MTRRLSLVLLGLAVLFALSACSRDEAPPEELRIGVLVPLTGTLRPYTGHLRAERLVERINAEGGLALGDRRVRVRLLVEDTGAGMEQALSVGLRLIQMERVSALVGPYFSRHALLVANATEAARIPMVTPTASSPELTRGRAFAFRVCLTDDVQGRHLARFAFEDLGLRTAAVLFDESDGYTSGLARAFASAFGRLGGRALPESHPAGATDFSAQLARVRQSGAQALFLPDYAADVVRQMAQARASGFDGLFLGGDSWEEGSAVLELPEAQGAHFVANYAPDQIGAPVRREFAWLWEDAANPPDNDGAMLLDALGVVLAAARSVGSVDPATLRGGLAALRGYEGLSGQLSFASGGDARRVAFIVVIRDGRAVTRRVLGPE